MCAYLQKQWDVTQHLAALHTDPLEAAYVPAWTWWIMSGHQTEIDGVIYHESAASQEWEDLSEYGQKALDVAHYSAVPETFG